MTKCGYPATALYGLTDGECGQDVRWRMVAGTTACPEILEFRLCSVHAAMCVAVPNLPSRLRDFHGHRMEEAVVRDLEDPDGGDVVLFNDLEQPGEDPVWPLPNRRPPSVCPRCPECGKPYGTRMEAMACRYRDLRWLGAPWR